MVFSISISTELQKKILSCWAVQSYQQYEKYLDPPLVVGIAKDKAFSYIKHKVWVELQSWKQKPLSQEGKKVLIKREVLRKYFSTSYFKLPRSLCIDLQNMMSRFCQGQRHLAKRNMRLIILRRLSCWQCLATYNNVSTWILMISFLKVISC